MHIVAPNPEDHLFLELRTRTAQRLRAAARGDHGVALLVAREREACLARLRDGWRLPGASLQSAA